jgi:hypothetical protein
MDEHTDITRRRELTFGADKAHQRGQAHISYHRKSTSP